MQKITHTSEYSESCALAQALDLKRVPFIHVPNGENRNPITGARLKRMGVKAGFPDYIIFRKPKWGTHEFKIDYKKKAFAVILELKKRTGRLRPNQKEWLALLEDSGYAVIVAFGAQDALDKLDKLGI